MPLTTRYALALAVTMLAITGCTRTIPAKHLGTIYSRSAQSQDDRRNPVIVIPGILGSKLRQRDTERIVWGAFTRGYADPRTPDGQRIISLPMRKGAALHELQDDVYASDVLDRVRLDVIGLPLELDAYINIMATLGIGGYRDYNLARAGAVDYGTDHFTCFQFAYDWRRDIVESAKALHENILMQREFIRQTTATRGGQQDRDVRFDLVAHSMGGLVARYYLMYGTADLPEDGSLPELTWAGAAYVDRLIMIGTPNAGSLRALLQLVEGTDLAPVVPTYPAALLGTFPSVYQLLPRGHHGVLVDASQPAISYPDLTDPSLWQSMQWGLASPQADDFLRTVLPDTSDPAERRHIAEDHLNKCLLRARQFQAAIDRPARRPAGLDIFLFAGDAEATPAVASANPATGRVRIIRENAGDGTVLRSSALLDERSGHTWTSRLQTPIDWSGIHFLFEDHIGLTQSKEFDDNVLFMLLEDPRGPAQQP